MFIRPLRVCWKPQLKTSQRSGIRIEIIVLWPTRAVLIPLHANTPFQLMFGREMRIPLDVMIGEPQGNECSYSEFAADLRDNLEVAYQAVRQNLKSAQRRQ